MEVKVSVIVATYRRETELARALESLAMQTYPHFEIVLVDDNDDTIWNVKVATVAENFKQRHPQIPCTLLVNHPNAGSAQTRNIGIEAAIGDYITFLDDDDVYLPDKLEAQVMGMEDTEADFSITDLLLYFDNDVLSEKRTRSYIQKNDNESLLKYHLLHHMTGTDTLMFRREFLRSIGGFGSVDVGDEFYLICNAIRAGGRFAYFNHCKVKAYVHVGEGGLSSGLSKIEGENALFDYKKQFFSSLKPKEIRYVRTRHYAVLAFAALRIKQYGDFIKNSCLAFFTSPFYCLSILFSR